MKESKKQTISEPVIIQEGCRLILPPSALEMFRLKAGSELLLLADRKKGMALVKANGMLAKLAEKKQPHSTRQSMIAVVSVCVDGGVTLPEEAMELCQMYVGDGLQLWGDRHRGMALEKTGGHRVSQTAEEGT